MRTIAVIALKGGSGKTTVATHLALAAHLRGLKTLVADIDPQQSAVEVLQAREREGPEYIATSGADLYAAKFAAIRSQKDAMIIDTAAGAIEDLGHAIVLADLSLLIVRPTLLDLAAAVRTANIVQRLKKPVMAVMNQAPVPRDGIEAPTVQRALRALKMMRLPLVPTILRSRAIYQTALETGRSAEERGDEAAIREIVALWAFIERFTFARREAPIDG